MGPWQCGAESGCVDGRRLVDRLWASMSAGGWAGDCQVFVGGEPGRGGETRSGLRPGGLGVPWVIHLSEVRVRRQVQETECVQGLCDTDFDSKVYVGCEYVWDTVDVRGECV